MKHITRLTLTVLVYQVNSVFPQVKSKEHQKENRLWKQLIQVIAAKYTLSNIIAL